VEEPREASPRRTYTGPREALATLISAPTTNVVPGHLEVGEESEESIGQGVVYRGVAYALNDVIVTSPRG